MIHELSKEMRQALIEENLHIRNKRKETVPFKFNVAQQFYWDRMTRRNIILKARQKGITKVIDADQYIQCACRPTTAVVVSHERESTERLFEAVKFYNDTIKIKPEVSIDSKRMMKFPKRGSSYFVGTAGQRAFGRGDTIDRAHLSEAAFYPDLDNTLAGIEEAAEFGQIDIESTANGAGPFKDRWEKAKQGLSAYTPIFIPWFIDGEYSSESLTEKEIKGLSPAVRELFLIPDEDFKWTDEEKELYKRVLNDFGIRLNVGQMKWRRYKIWDKGELFWQEYPEDDVSCFLQAGRSVFKHIKIDPSLKIPLDNIERMKDEDRIRLLGDKGTGKKRKMLYAGLDPAEGTLTGDPHAFAVVEANSPYHPRNGAVVIFEYVSNEPIDIFMEKVARICRVFDINLGIEKQGVGVAMINKAEQLDVYYVEWSTTSMSRPILVTDLEENYRKEDLIETYPEAEAEARNMIYNDSNRPEHPNGKHDDRVFARGIALQMLNEPKPGIEYFG